MRKGIGDIMFKYNDVFNDTADRAEEDAKKFIMMMKSHESSVINVKLGSVVIAVPVKYFPSSANCDDGYMELFYTSLVNQLEKLKWGIVKIDTMYDAYMHVTMAVDSSIMAARPLEYELNNSDSNLYANVLAKTLKADRWFPELFNSDTPPDKVYDYVIKDLEYHLTRLDDNRVTMTARDSFGAVCANAVYTAYKNEFPFVAVEKDEFDNCRVTLMSYSSEKNGEQPYDGVSPYDFTLPYEIIDDADELY